MEGPGPRPSLPRVSDLRPHPGLVGAVLVVALLWAFTQRDPTVSLVSVFALVLAVFALDVYQVRFRGRELVGAARGLGLECDTAAQPRLRRFAARLAPRSDEIGAVVGRIGGGTYVFDHSYWTGSGRDRRRVDLLAVAVPAPVTASPFLLTDKDAVARLGDVLGMHGVEIESNEFTAKYRISCADRAVAFEILDPALIGWLLDHTWPATLYRVAEGYAVCARPRDLSEIAPLTDHVREFARRIRSLGQVPTDASRLDPESVAPERTVFGVRSLYVGFALLVAFVWVFGIPIIRTAQDTFGKLVDRITYGP